MSARKYLMNIRVYYIFIATLGTLQFDETGKIAWMAVDDALLETQQIRRS